jgi:hypothetical protein
MTASALPGMETSAELAALRKYALAATRTITELTAGGSEYFAGKIGDVYVADLDFCNKHIRESRERGYQRWLEAERRAKDAFAAGREAERAEIVAWLRKQRERTSIEKWKSAFVVAAEAIQRLHHIPAAGKMVGQP